MTLERIINGDYVRVLWVPREEGVTAFEPRTHYEAHRFRKEGRITHVIDVVV